MKRLKNNAQFCAGRAALVILSSALVLCGYLSRPESPATIATAHKARIAGALAPASAGHAKVASEIDCGGEIAVRALFDAEIASE